MENTESNSVVHCAGLTPSLTCTLLPAITCWTAPGSQTLGKIATNSRPGKIHSQHRSLTKMLQCYKSDILPSCDAKSPIHKVTLSSVARKAAAGTVGLVYRGQMGPDSPGAPTGVGLADNGV